MFNIGKFKIYLGTKGWGWTMFGFGWGSKIFIGISIANKEETI